MNFETETATTFTILTKLFGDANSCLLPMCSLEQDKQLSGTDKISSSVAGPFACQEDEIYGPCFGLLAFII